MMVERRGFMLIELLIVIAIIAFLSALSIPSFMKFLAKSKRTEAYMVLRSLYLAEKGYHLEHGVYSTALTGNSADSLGWKPEGTLQYTYGFPGSEGRTFLVGSLKAPGSALQGAGITEQGFVLAAAADIDSDGTFDLITIKSAGVIKVVTDDLAS